MRENNGFSDLSISELKNVNGGGIGEHILKSIMNALVDYVKGQIPSGEPTV